jgi:fatty acid desaturase
LGSRPKNEVILALGQIFAEVFVVYQLLQRGYAHEVLYGWIIPGRLSVGFLACFFDYLPHRPPPDAQGTIGTPTPRTLSDYTATCVTSLFSQTDMWMLSYVLLYQNYHNIHHLAPYIPFYTYAKVWHHFEDKLKEQGTVVNSVLGPAQTQHVAAAASASKKVK